MIVRAAALPTYVLCADPDGALEHCLRLWRELRRYKDAVTANSWTPIIKGLEETIVTVLEVAGNEEEAVQLLEGPGEAEERLKTVLELVESDMLSISAHPTIQAIVDREWYGEALPVNLRTTSMPICVILSLLCYFFLAPLAIVFPHPKLLWILQTPIVQFALDALSYLVILILCIVVASVTHADIVMMCHPEVGQSEIRWVELWQLLLTVMLIAILLRFASGLWSCGGRFFVSGYNVLHFIGVLFHFLGSLLILLFFKVLPQLDSFHEVCAWVRTLPNSTDLESSCTASEAAYKRYPVVMDAIKTFGEPYIVGTTIFGFGHLLYFVSAGHVLSMFRLMAAFIIAVERMIFDVARWFIFCLIFFLAWTVAMETVYSSYRCNNIFFSSFSSSISELFWASLTMAGRSDFKLVGEVARSPSWLEIMVEHVGWVMYMLFYLVGSIILLNLLIALMAVTFQNIQDDKEFVLIRRKTRVKLKFVLWEDSLPAPFNLLHPVLLISKLIWRRYSCFCCSASVPESTAHQEKLDLKFVQSKLKELRERYRGCGEEEEEDLISASPHLM